MSKEIQKSPNSTLKPTRILRAAYLVRWASAAYPLAVVACFIEGVKRNRSVQWQSIE